MTLAYSIVFFFAGWEGEQMELFFFPGCEVDTMISIESAIFEGTPSSQLGACVALVHPATVARAKASGAWPNGA